MDEVESELELALSPPEFSGPAGLSSVDEQAMAKNKDAVTSSVRMVERLPERAARVEQQNATLAKAVTLTPEKPEVGRAYY